MCHIALRKEKQTAYLKPPGQSVVSVSQDKLVFRCKSSADLNRLSTYRDITRICRRTDLPIKLEHFLPLVRVLLGGSGVCSPRKFLKLDTSDWLKPDLSA